MNLEINYEQLKKLYNIVTEHNDCNPMVWDQEGHDLGEYLGDILIKEIQRRNLIEKWEKRTT